MKNSDASLQYKIVEKPAFTLIGKSRLFPAGTTYRDIPKFWAEIMSQNCGLSGQFGLCIDRDGQCEYAIADLLPAGKNTDGYQTYPIPAHTWAVFPCVGALPEALQTVNTKVWNEWLPGNGEYELAADYSLEAYFEQPVNGEPYSEILVPVKRKK